MIIVRNRELLVPNNERYIGTTYDVDSEFRLFEIPRFASNGVDLGNLIFKLDLKYADGTKDTADLTIEVTDGEVELPPEEDVEHICIEQHPHPHHRPHHHHAPKKEDEWKIHLTWQITSSVLQVPGTVFINLRATDANGTVKWASFQTALYVEDTINTPGSDIPEHTLTELEQLEAAIGNVLNSESSRVQAEEEREHNETVRQDAEAGRQSIFEENELQRQQNEIVREGAEALRQQTFEANEALREAAETAREESFNEKSLLSKSYAIGGTGIREGEDTDNAKYYKEQAEAVKIGALRFDEELDRIYFGDSEYGADGTDVSAITSLDKDTGVAYVHKLKDTNARAAILINSAAIEANAGEIDKTNSALADLAKEVEDAGIDNAVLGDLTSQAETEIPVLANADTLGNRITAEDVEAKMNKADMLTLEEIEASTDLTGKGAAASSVKSLSDQLVNYEPLIMFSERTISFDANGVSIVGFEPDVILLTATAVGRTGGSGLVFTRTAGFAQYQVHSANLKSTSVTVDFAYITFRQPS